MSTRDQLLQRSDVRREDIDDIIEIASRLHDDDRDAVKVSEVEAVARDLDIDPRFVETAIAELRGKRADAEKQRAAEVAAGNRLRWQVGVGLVAVAAAVLLLGGLFAAGVVGLGLAGAAELQRNEAVEQRAAAELDSVLDRQASLAPQLVALAGGNQEAVLAEAGKLREAQGLEARLRASDQLGAEMATALAQAPRPADEAASQRLLELQYEVTGSVNRITAARRSHDEALVVWRATAGSPSGRIAVLLGLAEGP